MITKRSETHCDGESCAPLKQHRCKIVLYSLQHWSKAICFAPGVKRTTFYNADRCALYASVNSTDSAVGPSYGLPRVVVSMGHIKTYFQ